MDKRFNNIKLLDKYKKGKLKSLIGKDSFIKPIYENTKEALNYFKYNTKENLNSFYGKLFSKPE